MKFVYLFSGALYGVNEKSSSSIFRILILVKKNSKNKINRIDLSMRLSNKTFYNCNFASCCNKLVRLYQSGTSALV
jgi:hypothetical protein